MKKELNEKRPYIFWADFIRVASIFLVVLTHAASPVIRGFDQITLENWMPANVYGSLARVCVPLLFMISGSLLLGRKDHLTPFFAGRVKKILIPFLAWSVIYLAWQNDYGNYTFVNAVKAMIYSMLTGLAYYHLWFLRALLLVYLFVPLFQGFVQASDEKTLWYPAILWFVFGPLLDSVREHFKIDIKIDLGFFTDYIGYFYFGYVLGRLNYSKLAAGLAGLVFILSSIYTINMTYAATSAEGDYVEYYHNYLRLNTALMSLSAFVWMKFAGERLGQAASPAAVRILKHAASVSFGVYLVHAAVLVMLERGGFGYSISVEAGPSFYMIPLVTVIVFAISWLIVVVIQRVPILRAITPH
jgi:surface polysaccharide O-acyltransferase-like enzyme